MSGMVAPACSQRIGRVFGRFGRVTTASGEAAGGVGPQGSP
jgi:hypothetical protein